MYVKMRETHGGLTPQPLPPKPRPILRSQLLPPPSRAPHPENRGEATRVTLSPREANILAAQNYFFFSSFLPPAAGAASLPSAAGAAAAPSAGAAPSAATSAAAAAVGAASTVGGS